PDAPPAEDEDLVELCRCTSLTPSINLRRCSVWATSDWLVEQPVSTIEGVLPGGVLETGVAPALAACELEPLLVGPPAVPTSVCSEESLGSTRPSSCSVCDQSKRACTSCATVFVRCSAIATKLV